MVYDEVMSPCESTGRKHRSEVLYHDVFSALSLCVVLFYDVLFLLQYFGAPFLGIQAADSSEHLQNGRVILKVLCTYLAFDTVWVALVPTCVPSEPMLVIIHHVVILLYAYFPWNYSAFCIPCACAALVELNTLFLLLRRNMKHGSVAKCLCHWMFLATWVVFRLMLFPVVLVIVVQQYLEYSSMHGSYLNVMAMGPIFQFLLTGMSIWWTAALVRKLKMNDKMGEKTKPAKVSSVSSLALGEEKRD